MGGIIGWDVGGVHLKGARNEGGRIVAAVQVASHLGYGTERLEQAFEAAIARLGPADRHAVTMTGELADIFTSRAVGVDALAKIAVAAAAPAPVVFYAGSAGFIPFDGVGTYVREIASANWHASAALVAQRHRDALLVDMGSTTTDIVPITGGRIAARGYTDVERLAAGELVYTGLVRSHVLAVASRAPVAGTFMSLMNEIFSDMGDVYRILGRLDPAVDLLEPADGGDKSPDASRRRLARMVAKDADELDERSARRLAGWFVEQQVRSIHDATMLVLSAIALPETAPIIAAGIGHEVVLELARRSFRPMIGFETMLELSDAAECAAPHIAPAAAVALLAANDGRGAA